MNKELFNKIEVSSETIFRPTNQGPPRPVRMVTLALRLDIEDPFYMHPDVYEKVGRRALQVLACAKQFNHILYYPIVSDLVSIHQYCINHNLKPPNEILDKLQSIMDLSLSLGDESKDKYSKIFDELKHYPEGL